LSVALAAGVALIATSAAADSESDCNRSIAKAVAHLRKSHQKRISKCLRFGNYDCPLDWLVIDQAENAVRSKVAGSGSDCDVAVHTDGIPVSSFGPAACPDSWNHCDVEVPAIATLDDLADCLVCIETGHDLRVRDEIDFPQAIDDLAVRSCVRSGYEGMAQAVRVATHHVDRCAAEAGAKPFDCPVDFSPGSSAGSILARIAHDTSRCIVDGTLPDAARRTCTLAMTSQADVTQCFDRLARCIACQAANATWEQGLDCAAFAGIWTCNGESAPPAGSFFVANGADDSVTFFRPDGSHAGTTLAAATHAAGDRPSALATNRVANAVYVADLDGGSVAYLHAATGVPANGTIAASSFATGASPAAVAVDEEYGIAFAIGSMSGDVTLLDALDGSYANGSQAASTVPGIAGASAVALDAAAHAALEASAALLERLGVGTRPQRDLEIGLTAREREVLRLVAQGKSNKEIAAALRISERTAKFHVTAIFNKLGAENRAQAVALAKERHMI